MIKGVLEMYMMNWDPVEQKLFDLLSMRRYDELKELCERILEDQKCAA